MWANWLDPALLNTVHCMDCIEWMKMLPDNSVDAIVTDPPYELWFMGKHWDRTGIAYNVEMRSECLRVLKPGGHLLAFSGTRTYHRMACAIEDAGFEVRDMIEWVYGSGFPKSLNIGKVTNKFLKTGNASWNGTGDSSNGALGYSKLQHQQWYRADDYSNKHQNKEEITEELAKQWEWRWTALKPAHEPICIARKPLSEKNVAENCLKWGTGGINIDASRVDYNGEKTPTGSGNKSNGATGIDFHGGNKKENNETSPLGRFPANLLHDNSEEVRECFPETKSRCHNPAMGKANPFGGDNNNPQEESYFNDSGNAARFFKSIIYQAKADKKDRGKWNNHATVKPTELIKYLIRMVSREWQTILDPFMWSWTTAVCCKETLRNYIWYDIVPEHIEIINKRLENTTVSLFHS